MDPGFILDETSGLYFHASSGFYHDPSAGWYYNSHDGVYYKFEEGTYVPIAAEVDDGNAVADAETTQSVLQTESTNAEELNHGALNSDDSVACESATKAADETVGVVDSPEEDGQSPRDTANGGMSDVPEGTAGLEVGFPLWHYDSVRSVYWYYDKESRAYYMYHQDYYETSVEGESANDPELFRLEHNDLEEGVVHGNGNGNASTETLETRSTQETSEDTGHTDNFKPTSGWVEETLIDLYLRGYPRGEAIEDDNGPWITSADIFQEDSQNASSNFDSTDWKVSDNRYSSATDEQPYPGYGYVLNGVEASIDESDNEGSEDLEEGEWVPDEPLQIIDGNMSFEDYEVHTRSKVRKDGQTWESISAAERKIYSGDQNDSLEDGELEEGEIEQDDGDVWGADRGEDSMQENHSKVDDGEKVEEEKWQAQFGQVVQEKSRQHVIPGAIELWDWTIVEMEPNPLKPGKVVKKLVGRIVSSVTKLVSASSGLIRTSAIRAAELDFVKVSSGKVYRLRRASLKHVTSLGSFDSSNPTKDWGFPLLGLASLNPSEDISSDVRTGAQGGQIERRTESLLSKPFVPNIGHWQFRSLESTNPKKGRPIPPPALLASKYLSHEEILINEQRKQKYRDRAAERRTLHGGFGLGPGQKSLNPRELDKLDADIAVGLEGALKSAATAPRLGRDNVGMRMLESMGWKEGQTLGVEGGLANPLQAQGNDSRAGLGWR